jgi:lipopolysaccharide transport system permease protein
MPPSYLRHLWAYRHYIGSAVLLEIKARFARSRLAGFWLVAQPLIQVAIYATILSSVLQAKLPESGHKYSYAIYLLAGTAAWGLFAEVLNRCLTMFIDHANTLKKVVFPRICLPAIVVVSAGFNYLLVMAASLVGVVLLKGGVGWSVLALLPLTLLVAAFSVGLGLFLGTLNVFMRDVGQVVGVLLQLWFWFTPLVYPLSIVPKEVVGWMHLNPMLPVVQAYQNIFLFDKVPDWLTLVPTAVVALLSLGLALVTFRRAAPDMVDVL